jgi:hypothetical protein
MERSAAKSNNVAAASATLEHARAEVKNFRERRDELALQIGRFQARVEGAPRVEQEIVTLTRDFNKLNENYLALLNKKLDAQLAAKLEQRWQGDRFRILDPASLPENPFFPNRLLFLLFGISAGLALGVGVALAADLLDQSFRSVRDLEDALPFPVLAAVPLIAPLRGSDVARKTRRGATTSLGLSASGGDVTDFMEARHVASRKRRGSK